MMKRIAAFLIVLFILSPLLYADYSDSLISAGEYENFVEWFNGTLVIDGGGGEEIVARNYSQIKVLSTSSPLGSDIGGIMDIRMTGHSHLDYYGGLTQEFTIGSYATADLYGGRIDAISGAQYTVTTGIDPHINIYCQEGWEWILDTAQKKVGITGQWMDNSSFTIHFTNNFQEPPFNADPVWTNIHVIPEPVTLLLFSLGSLIIGRKK